LYLFNSDSTYQPVENSVPLVDFLDESGITDESLYKSTTESNLLECSNPCSFSHVVENEYVLFTNILILLLEL